MSSARAQLIEGQLSRFSQSTGLHLRDHGLVYPRTKLSQLLAEILQQRGVSSRAAAQTVRDSLTSATHLIQSMGGMGTWFCWNSRLRTMYHVPETF